MKHGHDNTENGQSPLEFYLKIGIIGLTSGLVATIFRWGLAQAQIFRDHLYQDPNPWQDILLMISLAFTLSWVISHLLKTAPHTGGSGIPQAMADFNGQADTPIWPSLISKFFGGILNAIIGYSVGRQGPAVQMGSLIGKKIGLTSTLHHRRIFMAAGASAAIAASFNAPIAATVFSGLIFFKTFKHLGMLACLIASLIGHVTSMMLIQWPLSFDFTSDFSWSLASGQALVALAVTGTSAACVFQWGRKIVQSRIRHLPLTLRSRIVIISLIVGGLGFYMPQMQAGGHPLILTLAQESVEFKTLVLFWIVKLIVTLVCFNSGVQGGSFFPLLTLGALTGRLSFHILSYILGPAISMQTCLVLAMAAIMAGVLHLPLFSSLILIEMTGNLHLALPIFMTTYLAYLLAKAIKLSPLFDQLYQDAFSSPDSIHKDTK